MRLPLILVFAAGLALPALSPAAAELAEERQVHSMQCLLAMSAANGGAPDATARDAAKIGMLFFAGQLSGLDPDLDLPAAARAQLPVLTREKLQALIPQCGAEMRQRQAQLAALGPALKRNP